MTLEALRRIKSGLGKALTQAIADNVSNEVYNELLEAAELATDAYYTKLGDY